MDIENSAPSLFGLDLKSLIWPLSTKKFLDDYWNKHCFVSHGGLSRLSELTRKLNPNNVAGILAQSSEYSVLWSSDSRDAPPSNIPRRTALDLYENGNASLYMHLYHGMTDSSHPNSKTWKNWLVQIATDLGRLIHEGNVSVYASKAKLGLKPHFDPNDNYTIQLSGRKRWYYSDDASFHAPGHPSGTAFRSGKDLDRHILSTEGRHYVRNIHAISLPSNWESVVLKPGSMLYVPRGFWHWTESLETSISLNISLFEGHWCSYLLPLVEQLVLKDPAWRETASIGGASDTADVERLLNQLKSEIALLNPTDVLPISSIDKQVLRITDHLLLRRRLLTQYYVQHSQHSSEDVDVLFVDVGGRHATIKLPKHSLKALEWIESQRSPFTVAKLKQRLTSTVLNVQRFVEELVDADYLEPTALRRGQVTIETSKGGLGTSSASFLKF